MAESRLLKLIGARHSNRDGFDAKRPPSKKDLEKILEAARWAPTPHNMQNFDIVVVDDKLVLGELGRINSQVSEAFIRENYQQLSSSKEELLKRKTGILGSAFPSSWRDPGADFRKVARESGPSPLSYSIDGSPVVLIVVYDSRKRAPASKGDVLGVLGLGCVMENMWLAAQESGIGFQIMSVFSDDSVSKEVKRVLGIPDCMKISFACRLGYPVSATARKQLKVRRDIGTFAHHNRFGNKWLE